MKKVNYIVMTIIILTVMIGSPYLFPNDRQDRSCNGTSWIMEIESKIFK